MRTEQPFLKTERLDLYRFKFPAAAPELTPIVILGFERPVISPFPDVAATVIISKGVADRALLHMISTIPLSRRRGLAFDLLEALVGIYPHLHAKWASVSGAALADRFQSVNGARPEWCYIRELGDGDSEPRYAIDSPEAQLELAKAMDEVSFDERVKLGLVAGTKEHMDRVVAEAKVAGVLP